MSSTAGYPGICVKLLAAFLGLLISPQIVGSLPGFVDLATNSDQSKTFYATFTIQHVSYDPAAKLDLMTTTICRKYRVVACPMIASHSQFCATAAAFSMIPIPKEGSESARRPETCVWEQTKD